MIGSLLDAAREVRQRRRRSARPPFYVSEHGPRRDRAEDGVRSFALCGKRWEQSDCDVPPKPLAQTRSHQTSTARHLYISRRSEGTPMLSSCFWHAMPQSRGALPAGRRRQRAWS